MQMISSVVVFVMLLVFAASYIFLSYKNNYIKIAAGFTNLCLVVTMVWISFRYGQLVAQVTQGAPAYCVLENTLKRLKVNDSSLTNDLQILILKLNPKNAGGVNASIMTKYIETVELPSSENP